MLFSPLEQFTVSPLFSIEVGGYDLSFTNSSLVMLVALTLIVLMVYFSTSRGTVVPSRWQSVVELLYEFVETINTEGTGQKGQHYFPFVFTLFTFILFCNFLGMIPYSFTATGHIIVTFTLALSIFIGVTILGFLHHGFNYLSRFFPEGVTPAMAPILVPIELVSYFTAPVSLSVRLFANMLSGHILFNILAGFSYTMMGLGAFIYLIGLLPMAFLVILLGLELMICFIQAYVFTMLTVSYINGALHLH